MQFRRIVALIVFRAHWNVEKRVCQVPARRFFGFRMLSKFAGLNSVFDFHRFPAVSTSVACPNVRTAELNFAQRLRFEWREIPKAV